MPQDSASTLPEAFLMKGGQQRQGQRAQYKIDPGLQDLLRSEADKQLRTLSGQLNFILRERYLEVPEANHDKTRST